MLTHPLVFHKVSNQKAPKPALIFLADHSLAPHLSELADYLRTSSAAESLFLLATHEFWLFPQPQPRLAPKLRQISNSASIAAIVKLEKQNDAFHCATVNSTGKNAKEFILLLSQLCAHFSLKSSRTQSSHPLSGLSPLIATLHIAQELNFRRVTHELLHALARFSARSLPVHPQTLPEVQAFVRSTDTQRPFFSQCSLANIPFIGTDLPAEQQGEQREAKHVRNKEVKQYNYVVRQRGSEFVCISRPMAKRPARRPSARIGIERLPLSVVCLNDHLFARS